MKTTVFCGLAVALCVASCNTVRKVSVDSVGEVKTGTINQTEGAIQYVLYGQWIAADVSNMPVAGDNRPYIVFDKSATNPFILNCYAYDGCNTLNGSLAVTPGGQMNRTSDFMSTLRMCPDAPYETGFSLAINTVSRYAIEKAGRDYLLYFKDSAGKTTMVLRKSDLGYVNGAWRVAKINNTVVPEDAGIKMVIDVPELKIHGNAGCNTLNGSIYIDPDKQNSMQFRNIATTRMTCPQIELEQKFLAALSQAATVAQGTDSSIVFKNASGNTVLLLYKLNLK